MSVSSDPSPLPPHPAVRVRSSIVIADLIAASGIALLFLDGLLVVILETWRGHALALVALSVPDLGRSWSFLVTAILFLAAFRISSGNHRFTDKALFVINASSAAGFAADVLKLVFGRPRPRSPLAAETDVFHWFDGSDGLGSFPSGHAAVTAALAGSLAHLYPEHRLAIFSTAIVIASTRVIVGDHYLSDALFGFALGLSMVIAMQLLFDWCGIDLGPQSRNQGKTGERDRDGL